MRERLQNALLERGLYDMLQVVACLHATVDQGRVMVLKKMIVH